MSGITEITFNFDFSVVPPFYYTFNYSELFIVNMTTVIWIINIYLSISIYGYRKPT